MTLRRIGLGGGCHWCTEAVFQSLPAVDHVEQGFIASKPPDGAYSEAVVVHFDERLTDLTALIHAHLHTHSSTSNHTMRGKYRSAVYVFDADQARAAGAALAALQPQFEAPLVTRVLAFESFRPSDPRFQNYFETDPDRPFCRTYIRPKLETLKTLAAAAQAVGPSA